MRETAESLPGPAGILEARITGLAELQAGAPDVAVVCHPHSQFGGSMQNKVVTTLLRLYRDRGVPGVRFNFRSVGRSEGAYDAGLGETDDVLAVVRWLDAQFPGTRLWLNGFSFGSFVAARAACRLLKDERELAQLVLVAPAVVNFDFDGLLPLPVPTLVLQGDADEVVDPDAVFAWLDALDPKPHTEVLEGCSHFFHGRLTDLKDRMNAALDAVHNT